MDRKALIYVQIISLPFRDNLTKTDMAWHWEARWPKLENSLLAEGKYIYSCGRGGGILQSCMSAFDGQ